MKKVISYVRQEAVLCIAVFIAAVSSFLVPPDAEYIHYIDFRTLSILFCLMAVMAGLKQEGVFDLLAGKLLQRIKSTRSITFVLVMLCFFFSMLITNDIALITFVPFTFVVLKISGNDKLIVRVVIMQTISANLGSMFTPLGNPQNLYLYTISGMNIVAFFKLMLPYTAASFFMLCIWSIMCKSSSASVKMKLDTRIKNVKHMIMYVLLFAVCTLAVMRVLHYAAVTAVVIAVVLIADRGVLKKIDYSLLVTFTGFFIFIGNMGRIEPFRELLYNMISGREMLTAVAASQVISNVPAAILLSGFTENISELIVGTNLGGLGTLIASMASLISFKYIAIEDKHLCRRYVIYFTVSNILFLALLCMLWYCIS